MIEGLDISFKIRKKQQFENKFITLILSMKRVERKILKQRDLMRQKNESRKTERQTKNEAIRVKYG